MHRVLALVWMALLFAVTSAADYCSVCSDHTMCLYKSRGANCRGLYTRSLTPAEKQDALDAHNSIRNWVAAGQEGRGRSAPQPSAANMQKLYWDDELASFAQRWASQCQFKHDTCRTSADGTQVGQNIYMEISSSLPPTVSVKKAALSWYNEVDDVDGRSNFRPYSFDLRTGHYTQLVWADTTSVGCGFADFKDKMPSRLIVCNYKEGGNVLGRMTYSVGPPASQCFSGAAGRTRSRADPAYPALCA